MLGLSIVAVLQEQLPVLPEPLEPDVRQRFWLAISSIV
jgi:hypothetical protein